MYVPIPFHDTSETDARRHTGDRLIRTCSRQDPEKHEQTPCHRESFSGSGVALRL